MTVIEKFREISSLLKSYGIKEATKEAEIFIMHVLNISKTELYSAMRKVSEEESCILHSLIERRIKGEPIQYIIGYVEFYGLRINVGKGVLIPRPETELLVEEAIREISKGKVSVYCQQGIEGFRLNILDLCTGSGCIALALAWQFPDADVYGVDKSDIAIEYAMRNAIENKIKNVYFLKGDLFEPVKNKKFDCIVSNPPYIKRSDVKDLQKEIRDYEPIDALDGGEDGLDFYRRIFNGSPNFLNKDGFLMLEIGYNQADEIKEMAIKSGFKDINFRRDYSGIRRIFVGYK